MVSAPIILIGSVVIGLLLMLLALKKSIHNIGPNEVGDIVKMFSKKLPEGKLLLNVD